MIGLMVTITNHTTGEVMRVTTTARDREHGLHKIFRRKTISDYFLEREGTHIVVTTVTGPPAHKSSHRSPTHPPANVQ